MCSNRRLPGLVGRIIDDASNNSPVTISNCWNSAIVTGIDTSTDETKGQNAAGILGCNYDGDVKVTIENCYNTGSITGARESAAISGWLANNPTVINTYNTGTIEGFETGKTFARFSNNPSFTNAYQLDTVGSQNSITSKTVAEFASGHLAYLLNDQTSVGNLTWGQKLGLDGDPSPVLFSDDIVYKDGENEDYSNSQYLGAPTGLAGIAPTSADNTDGKITGTTTEMEYKLASADNSAYVVCLATETIGLAAGDYLARFAAKAGFNASPTTQVTVPAYVAPVDPVVDTAVSATGVNAGQTLAESILSGTFKVSAEDSTGVEGTLLWTTPSTEVSASGQFEWTFTPTATETYNTITGNVLVAIVEGVYAKKPVITNDLESKTTTIGTEVQLDATATVTDGGTLSYKWFSADDANKTNSQEIAGQVGATYSPSVDTVGTFYYYAQVTNTITDNGDDGQKTAETTSAVSTVTVEKIEITGYTSLAAVTLDTDEHLYNLEALIASNKLPEQVILKTATTEKAIDITNWTGDFDGTTGNKTLTAEWAMPNDYKDAESPISVVLTVTVTVAQTNFAGGSGIAGDPYQVSNAEQLDNVRNYLDKHFTQTADIDLGVSTWNDGKGWNPIGKIGSEFTGTYDGNNKNISNLTINRSNSSRQGLLGRTYGSTLRNINLKDVNVEALQEVGGLVGYNNRGNIENSHVAGRVAGNVAEPNSYVGGLVGLNFEGTIVNSYATASVSGQDCLGGLVGLNFGGTIENSYATGSVTGTGAVGGLVGHNRENNDTATINKSYATGFVSGSGNLGGLVGMKNSDTTVTDSYYDSQTTGQSDTGKGTPKTPTEMGQIATFDGWSFHGTPPVWSITSGNYPQLVWESGDPTPVPDINVTAKNVIVNGTATIINVGLDLAVTGLVKDNFTVTKNDQDYTNFTVTETDGNNYILAMTDAANENDVFTVTITKTDYLFTGTEVTRQEEAPSLVDDYYELLTAEDLNWFSRLVSGELLGIIQNGSAKAKLMNDIVAKDDFEPIGYYNDNDTSIKQAYTGEFDGQGHTVTLNMDKTGIDGVGLFGGVKGGTVIKNVGVAGQVKGKAFVAGLVGTIKRDDGTGSEATDPVTISNAWNSAAIHGTAQNVAGILGCNTDGDIKVIIENSYNTGSITGDRESAAISGWLSSNSTITNTYNKGTVVGYDSGKSFARFNSATFTDSYQLDTVGSQTGITSKTAAEFASGHLAYLLNGETSAEPLVWKQKLGLGGDPSPVLFSDDIVYKDGENEDYSNSQYQGAPVTGLDILLQLGETTTATAATTQAGAGAWTSSNTAVASVDGSTGLVTALTAGTTTISYTTSTSGNLNSKEITVYEAASIVNPTIGQVKVGAGDVTPTGFTNPEAGETILWMSTDIEKATVDVTTGVITPLAAGNTAINYMVTNDTTNQIVAKGFLEITVLAGDTAEDLVINISAIPGVVAPVRGESPVTTQVSTDQYIGTVAWSPAADPFAVETIYTATITLTAKAGFTLDGVAANFFTVDGATATNAANNGVITTEFPATAGLIQLTGGGGITGTLKVGEQLTAGDALPQGATVNYQWKSYNYSTETFVDIEGATGKTYTLLAEDVGKGISVRLIGTGIYTGAVQCAVEGPVKPAEQAVTYGISGQVSGFAGGNINLNELDVTLYMAEDTSFLNSLGTVNPIEYQSASIYTMVPEVVNGSYLVRIEAGPGYKEATASVTVSGAPVTDANITLEAATAPSDPLTLEGVTANDGVTEIRIYVDQSKNGLVKGDIIKVYNNVELTGDPEIGTVTAGSGYLEIGSGVSVADGAKVYLTLTRKGKLESTALQVTYSQQTTYDVTIVGDAVETTDYTIMGNLTGLSGSTTITIAAITDITIDGIGLPQGETTELTVVEATTIPINKTTLPAESLVMLYSNLEGSNPVNTFNIGDTVYVKIDNQDGQGQVNSMIDISVKSDTDTTGVTLKAIDNTGDNYFYTAFTVTANESSAIQGSYNLKVASGNTFTVTWGEESTLATIN